MDKYLPKGVNLVVPILAIGHNRYNFEKPFEFRPERFEAAERTEANAFDNVPFSAGPRNCIGNVASNDDIEGLKYMGISSMQVKNSHCWS